MSLSLTKELVSLRPLGVGLFRPILAADTDAFNIYWELTMALPHPMLRLEVRGWLVEKRVARTNLYLAWQEPEPSPDDVHLLAHLVYRDASDCSPYM
jgi:hypothetical protein